MTTTRMMTLQEIEECSNRIRGAAASGWLTNYFKQPLMDPAAAALAGEKALVFLDREDDFHHLYFSSADPAELARLLAAVEPERVTLDYLTRAPQAELQAAFEGAGMRLRSKYVHISAPMPKVHPALGPTEFAREDEAAALRARMPGDLDRFCDHFPTVAALREWIADRRVLVCREDGAIAGYFIFQVTGVRAHLNYWYTEKAIGPAKSLDLLLRAYAEMARRGVKYVYAWVDHENTKVLNIHQRFGLVFDGLYDFIYQRGIHEQDT